MATKAQLVADAYTELGLPPWVYSIAPEQLLYGCSRMDAMVAQWAGIDGVRIAYNFGQDPNADAGIALSLQQAVTLQLAIALAPQLGKTPSEQTLALAESAWSRLLIAAAQPPQVQLPATMPRGAGAKAYRFGPYQTFVPRPDLAPLGTSGDGTQLDFKQE